LERERKRGRVTKHLSARELPISERPYEKCLLEGAEALSDAELLAVILKSGSRNMNVVELSRCILQAGGGNLLSLYQLSLEELMAFPGMGQVKAIQLKCVAELSRRIARTSRRSQVSLANPGSVADYYMERLRHEPVEQLLVSMFDSKCHLIGERLLSTGSVRSVQASPREIFIHALEQRAVSIILLHNHPSGDPSPSREDRLLTERVRQCGELLEIELSDHIIIGDNRYYSFREKKQMIV
jgi:DNA repair protein RadC